MKDQGPGGKLDKERVCQSFSTPASLADFGHWTLDISLDFRLECVL